MRAHGRWPVARRWHGNRCLDGVNHGRSGARRATYTRLVDDAAARGAGPAYERIDHRVVPARSAPDRPSCLACGCRPGCRAARVHRRASACMVAGRGGAGVAGRVTARPGTGAGAAWPRPARPSWRRCGRAGRARGRQRRDRRVLEHALRAGRPGQRCARRAGPGGTVCNARIRRPTTLSSPNVSTANGTPYRVFTPFWRACRRAPDVTLPVPPRVVGPRGPAVGCTWTTSRSRHVSRGRARTGPLAGR